MRTPLFHHHRSGAARCGAMSFIAFSLLLNGGTGVTPAFAQDSGGPVPTKQPDKSKQTNEADDDSSGGAVTERAPQPIRRPRPTAQIPSHDPADEVALGDGLVIAELKVGDGLELERGDVGVFEFTGWLAQSGNVFNTNMRGDQRRLITTVPGRLIEGWNRGLIGMKEGGRRKLIVPSSLGYGAKGYEAINVGPNADLVFLVQLDHVLREPEIELSEANRADDGALWVDLEKGKGPQFERNGYGTFHVSWWDDNDRLEGTTLEREDPVLVEGDALSGWSVYSIGMQSGGQRAVYATTTMLKDDNGTKVTETVRRTYLIEADEITPALNPPDYDPKKMKDLGDGLLALDLKEGDGREVPKYALPEINFTGWRSDGSIFDTTRAPGGETRIVSPEFDLKVWGAGLRGMKTGGKRLLVVPPQFAYGEDGSEELRIKPNETLLIEVEVINHEMPLFLPPEALEDEEFMKQWNEEFGGEGFGGFEQLGEDEGGGDDGG